VQLLRFFLPFLTFGGRGGGVACALFCIKVFEVEFEGGSS